MSLVHKRQRERRGYPIVTAPQSAIFRSCLDLSKRFVAGGPFQLQNLVSNAASKRRPSCHAPKLPPCCSGVAGFRTDHCGKSSAGRFHKIRPLSSLTAPPDQRTFIVPATAPTKFQSHSRRHRSRGPHQDLTETACLFDLTKHRLGQRLNVDGRGCCGPRLDSVAHVLDAGRSLRGRRGLSSRKPGSLRQRPPRWRCR
jgi:hypothetical protein